MGKYRNITIEPGKYYRHFLGSLYQVDSIVEGETGKIVLYRKVYENGEFCEFLNKKLLYLFAYGTVDKEKFPNSTQEFLFEEETFGFQGF